MTEPVPTVNFAQQFDPSLTAWVRWDRGGFDVLLKYLPMDANDRMFKECKVTRWDAKSHQRVEETDEKKLVEKVADLIVEWRGATPRATSGLVAYKAGTEMDGIFPCDRAHKIAFLTHFEDFLLWVITTAKKLHEESARVQEEQTKN